MLTKHQPSLQSPVGDCKGCATFIGQNRHRHTDKPGTDAASSDSRRVTCRAGIGTMRPRVTLRKPAIVTRRLISLVVRAAVITSMSFAVAFGFLSGDDLAGGALRSELVRDRRCGAVRRRLRRHRHSHLPHPPDEGGAARARNAASKRRPTATGKSAKRRSAPKASSRRRATSSCAATAMAPSPMPTTRSARSPDAPREELLGDDVRAAGRGAGRSVEPRRRHPRARSEDRRRRKARAGSPGARSRCAPTAAAKCRASAAT